jgi:hypothetical protein
VVCRASGPDFMFCAPELIFGCTNGGSEGVVSRFHVLRSWTRFRRFRGRRVLFSCFALPDTFWAVPRASDVIFMFCAPIIVFGGTVGVRSVFMICAPEHVFGGAEGVGTRFPILCSRTNFRLFRGRRVYGRRFLFSLLCALVLVFGGTMGVGSCFHGLRSRTHF